MPIKINKIANYYIVPPHDGEITISNQPKAYFSRVTMRNEVAKSNLMKRYKKNEWDMPSGSVLHVCYDVNSGVLYIVNAGDFKADSDKMELMLDAAKLRILKDFGDYSSRPAILGSPFSLVRVRSINNFPYASEFIGEHHGNKLYQDLPVIEANLYNMPTTVESLPEVYRNAETYGGDIGPKDVSEGTFYDERDPKNPVVLLKQSAPFILVNIAADAKTTSSDKERIVLYGYRDYLDDQTANESDKFIRDNIIESSEVYAIKHLLYVGWNFEDVCEVTINKIGIADWKDLLRAITYLMSAVVQLEDAGHKSPANYHYYTTFKVGDDFPIKFLRFWDQAEGKISIEKQPYPYLKIVDYDMESSFITIETPAYLSAETCIKALNAKSRPFTGKYNPNLNCIDIRSGAESLSKMKCEDGGDRQLEKIKGYIHSDLSYEEDSDIDEIQKIDYKVRTSDVEVEFERKKISEFPYVYDRLVNLCNGLNINFIDINVITGPIQKIMGQGTSGGFISKKSCLEADPPTKLPIKFAEGLEVMPPVILISTEAHPKLAEQTSTLIHEYRHFINSMYENFKKTYGDMKDAKLKDWVTYLSDPDEKLAHKDQIKYNLLMGMTADEIIRDKVGGEITLDNYGIARKMSRLVEEAENELLKEFQNKKTIEETPIEPSSPLTNDA